jgi:acetyl-CoA carboxylase biotin carboxyl carrier protein
MTVKPAEILTLIELFKSSQWEELHVEVDGLQLFLSRDPGASLRGGTRTAPATPAALAATVPQASPSAPSAAPPAQAGSQDSIPAHWVAVTAPNLGTFYRAPKPGAAPFVTAGESVAADAEVCLLEVMKLFTTVKAGTQGVVRRVCVEDGSLVEFGHVLFYIEPA